jgi:hypothetical protein
MEQELVHDDVPNQTKPVAGIVNSSTKTEKLVA